MSYFQQEQKTNKESKSETGTISFWISSGKSPYGHEFSDHFRLPKKKKGNKYLLMIIDQFTKRLECFPLSTDSRRSCKELVDDFFCTLWMSFRTPYRPREKYGHVVNQL